MSILPIRDPLRPRDESADRLLIQQIVQQGNEGAFRHLYRTYTPALERLLRVTGIDDEDQLDDIVQETWVRATRVLDRFAWRSSFQTWLAGIANNVRREGRRATRLHEVRLSPTDLASVPDHKAAESPDGHGSLESLLSVLPPRLRTVFELRVIEGLPHTQIANQLGLTTAAVRVRYLRARRLLRASLLESPDQEEEFR